MELSRGSCVGRRQSRLRRSVLAVVLGAWVLGLAPSAALAAGEPDVFQFSFAGTQQIDVCGLTVGDQINQHGTIVTAPNLGLPRQMTFWDREVLSNTTGASIIVEVYQLDKDIGIVSNADGTTTFLTQLVGIPERLVASDGITLTMDVGRIVFSSTWDASGNQLSQSITTIAGPHPDADAGFALFCQFVDQELG